MCTHLQFIILEGSAGGAGSVPPTPRALRILTSPNTTETLALSLLFPLNTSRGGRVPCHVACTPHRAEAAASRMHECMHLHAMGMRASHQLACTAHLLHLLQASLAGP